MPDPSSQPNLVVIARGAPPAMKQLRDSLATSDITARLVPPDDGPGKG